MYWRFRVRTLANFWTGTIQNAQDPQSADVWRAAEHRRTDDLANWLSRYFTRERSSATDVVWGPVGLRFARMGALTAAFVTFAALTSVSAVVHAGKRPPFVLMRPTAPIPAVNVP
jgi:hypothetical protein